MTVAAKKTLVADPADLAPIEGNEVHRFPEKYLPDGESDVAALLAFVEDFLQRFPFIRVVGHTNFPETRWKA
jgi:hypothetical protein